MWYIDSSSPIATMLAADNSCQISCLFFYDFYYASYQWKIKCEYISQLPTYFYSISFLSTNDMFFFFKYV